MNSKVIPLNANYMQGEHLCIADLDGNAHVVPTEYFADIINGTIQMTEEDVELLLPTIIREWIEFTKTRKSND